MDVFLYEKYAMLRLQQRCSLSDDNTVQFRLSKNEGLVRLSTEEWEAVGRQFRARIAPSAKVLRLAVRLTIPFAIVLLMMIANIPILGAIADAADEVAPTFAAFVVTAGLPIAAMTWHAYAVQRAVVSTNETLSCRPRTSAMVRGRSKAVNILEILALVFLGPHVLVQVYGTMFPDAFRNTPLTGTRLDLSGYIALAVLVAVFFLRWRNRPMHDKTSNDETAPDGDNDVIARIRRHAQC